MGVGGRSVASWDPLTNSTACPTDPGPRKAGEDQGTPEPSDMAEVLGMWKQATAEVEVPADRCQNLPAIQITTPLTCQCIPC